MGCCNSFTSLMWQNSQSIWSRWTRNECQQWCLCFPFTQVLHNNFPGQNFHLQKIEGFDCRQDVTNTTRHSGATRKPTPAKQQRCFFFRRKLKKLMPRIESSRPRLERKAMLCVAMRSIDQVSGSIATLQYISVSVRSLSRPVFGKLVFCSSRNLQATWHTKGGGTYAL